MEEAQMLLNSSIGVLLLTVGMQTSFSVREGLIESAVCLFAAVCLSVHRLTLAYFTWFQGLSGFQATAPSVLLNVITLIALIALNLILLKPTLKDLRT